MYISRNHTFVLNKTFNATYTFIIIKLYLQLFNSYIQLFKHNFYFYHAVNPIYRTGGNLMNATGIIVEYNPMHNGHLFHLSQAKKITESNATVAVMSGNFVQRGEPAFVNKWARTQMALLGGVDLVIELPLIYSISSAEGFAFGCVATLELLGIKKICFGSESGDIKLLKLIANILTYEPNAYKKFLQKELKSGISFPKARQNALIEYIITNNYENVNSNIIENTLQSSNNILAIEYIKAISKLSSNIEPITINRINNNYNDMELTNNISSATAIRNNFNKNSFIKKTMPEYTFNIIQNELLYGRGPLSLMDFSELILYKIRNMSTTELLNILDMENGLNYSIKRWAEDSGDIGEMLMKLKSKRYTSTRLQRIMLYILLNITKDFSQKLKLPPQFIRVLGFNKIGQELLKKLKKTCPVKIITNPSSKDEEILKYDIAATDTYVLGYKNIKYKQSKQDLKTPPIIL